MKSNTVLQTPYTSAYSGGLIQYLLDFEEAYVEYDHLECTQALQENRPPALDSDARCKERLLEQLFHDRSLRGTIRQCCASQKTYREVIKYMNDEALAVYHIDHLNAVTRS